MNKNMKRIKKEIDESNTEELIPNFHDLKDRDKEKCLEEIYTKQHVGQFSHPPGTDLYKELQDKIKAKEEALNG